MRSTHSITAGNSHHWLLLALLPVLAFLLLAAVARAESLPDEKVAIAIMADLSQSDAVPGQLLDVAVKNGVVTLTGQVSDILAGERAAALASRIKGVRAVVNDISVLPAVKVSDVQLQRDVEQALAEDPASERFEIDVSAVNGEITLSGLVESWQEKKLAERLAKDVAGVREVHNDIEVSYAARRSDEEIHEDVSARLAWDLWLDDKLVEVSVDDGTVVLEGSVGSLAEKHRAQSRAWVAGVRQVDSQGLEVDWSRRDEMRRDYRNVVKSDQDIRRAVQDAMLYDPRVNSFNPDIIVENGVVTLTGTVGNLAAKRAAGQDAQNTLGVWRVKNYLRVRDSITASADELERRIARRLETNAVLRDADISVAVADNTAFLSGQVNNEYEKRLADDVAATVPGVAETRNALTVFRPADVLDDWQIQQDIESQLFWSPFVDGDAVSVEVEDGVATLRGQVEGWNERQAAEENAREGGALVVHNQLEVEESPDWIF